VQGGVVVVVAVSSARTRGVAKTLAVRGRRKKLGKCIDDHLLVRFPAFRAARRSCGCWLGRWRVRSARLGRRCLCRDGRTWRSSACDHDRHSDCRDRDDRGHSECDLRMLTQPLKERHLSGGGSVIIHGGGRLDLPQRLLGRRRRVHFVDFPIGVDMDATANVYVADGKNNRVLKLPASSTIQTELPFTRLNDPMTLSVDTAENGVPLRRRQQRGAQTPCQ
jgi:DNA-binding beta-propeller fold protein YncE